MVHSERREGRKGGRKGEEGRVREWENEREGRTEEWRERRKEARAHSLQSGYVNVNLFPVTKWNFPFL